MMQKIEKGKKWRRNYCSEIKKESQRDKEGQRDKMDLENRYSYWSMTRLKCPICLINISAILRDLHARSVRRANSEPYLLVLKII